MKKIFSFMFCLIMLAGVLSGCGSDNIGDPGKLKIVTTVFAEYDWVREILGEKLEDTELIMLTDNGSDMHSYQLTADDIVTISSCDLFIYIGGVSDLWVDEVLREVPDKKMTVLRLFDVMGDLVKTEETVEGMQGEDEEHDENAEDLDEHIWLSLKNAQISCNAIANALCAADPENSDLYAANAAAYIEKLSALDEEYRLAADNAERKTLLFCDRFPFRYLTDDYGLTYYAAFAGCSAETEASFETISFLANKLDELELGYVLIIDGTQDKIAQTVIRSSSKKDQKILVLNSMQSVTADDINNGMSYLSVMENNLSVLKEFWS